LEINLEVGKQVKAMALLKFHLSNGMNLSSKPAERSGKEIILDFMRFISIGTVTFFWA
jgi:hypothetical protein